MARGKYSQAKAVLEHMSNKGKITSMEAFELYGITRLSDVIFRLRKRGYDIVTFEKEMINRYGNNTRYAEYIYKGEI